MGYKGNTRSSAGEVVEVGGKGLLTEKNVRGMYNLAEMKKIKGFDYEVEKDELPLLKEISQKHDSEGIFEMSMLLGDQSDAELKPENDVFNPAMDHYNTELRRLYRGIREVITDRHIKYNAIKYARLKVSGFSDAAIAERFGVKESSVNNLLKKPASKQMVGLMLQLSLMIQGTSVEQREHILWRIALKNENLNPNASINAIAHINKMHDVKNGVPPEGSVTVIVQNAVLGQSALDG